MKYIRTKDGRIIDISNKEIDINCRNDIVFEDNTYIPEDDLIREKYPTMGGIGLVKFIPHRTSNEISHRATCLGVKRDTYRRKVKCIETGQVFKDAREACRVIGITPKHANANILDVCKGKKGKKTAYGYHWEFIL